MSQISYSGPDSEIQREIHDKIEALSRIADIAKQDNHINILFEQFLDILIEMVNLDSGIVKILDPRKTFFLKSETFHGISQKFLEKSSGNPIGGCLCSLAMAQKNIAYTADIARDRNTPCALCKSEGFKFIACIPIVCSNEAIGVIQLASNKIIKPKPADIALMECAGKIFSNAMEYFELTKTNNNNKKANDIYLSILNEALLRVNAENLQIVDVSEYALKLLDIPKESLINAPISSIFGDGISKQLPILAENKSSINAIIGLKQIDCILKVYPSINDITGDYTQFVISIEVAKKELSIQERFDNFKKSMSDFMSILSNIDVKNNVQDFCDSAMIQIDSILPVMQSTYLIYFFDRSANQLQMIAHSGFSSEYINENAIISSENYEYKNVLNTKKIYSASDEEIGGWKIIVPLIYSGESRGIMILISDKQLEESLQNTRILYSMGSLVAAIMEKQALSDSLENTATVINNIKSKPDIILNSITSQSKNTSDRIKKLFESALSISNCEKVVLTIKKPTETKEYSLIKGGELTVDNNEVLAGSREAYVLENGEAVYNTDAEDSESEFVGDEDSDYRYIAVIPIIFNHMIIASMRFEGNTINEEFPETLINLIANIILSNITIHQNKQKIKKQSEEKENIERHLEKTKESLANEERQNTELKETNFSMTQELNEIKAKNEVSKNKIRELKQVISEVTSDKELLEREKIKLNNKIKIALENEEKQRTAVSEKQRQLIEARKQFQEEKESLTSDIEELKQKLVLEHDNSESLKAELKTEKESSANFKKIAEEESNRQKEKIKEYELELEETVANVEAQIQEEIDKYEKEIKNLTSSHDQERKKLVKEHEKERKQILSQHEEERNQMISEHEQAINDLVTEHDNKIKQKDIEKEEIIGEYESKINELNQALSDESIKLKYMKEVEEKMAVLKEQSEKALMSADQKSKKLLMILSVKTKEIIQSTELESIKDIVNETGKLIDSDYQDIVVENTDRLRQEVINKRAIFKNKENSIRLIWNSITDTAIRRIEEIKSVAKIKEIIKSAK